MYWTVPGTHEIIDLERCAVDPAWDDDYSVLDLIASALYREDTDDTE